MTIINLFKRYSVFSDICDVLQKNYDFLRPNPTQDKKQRVNEKEGAKKRNINQVEDSPVEQDPVNSKKIEQHKCR